MQAKVTYRPAFEEITVQWERWRTRQIIAFLGNMLWGAGDEPRALGVDKGHLAQSKNNRTMHLEMASRRRVPLTRKREKAIYRKQKT